MAKLSRQTKEIINIVIFLLVAGVLVYFYAVYPLGKTKEIMGRVNLDQYYIDSLPANSDSTWAAAGLPADTFTVEADGLTTLAGLYASARIDSITPAAGTVILLHAEKNNRDSLIWLAKALVDSGYNVIAYDQRAAGFSTGKYFGEGGYEAADLEEVIRFLDLREKITHPLSIVGFELGGDAALLASHEEQRIDKIIAVDPYLTTQNLLDRKIIEHKLLWFPFRSFMIRWWYEIRSSYAAPYRTIDDIKAVTTRTKILFTGDNEDTESAQKIIAVSDSNLIEIVPIESKGLSLLPVLFKFLRQGINL